MFSIFHVSVSNITEWCAQGLSEVTKSIWAISILVIYGCILLLMKIYGYLKPCFDKKDFNMLYQAAQQNDLIRVITILNQCPSYVNKFKYPEGYTPFMVACANANTQMVRYMLKMGANVALKSKADETPFYLTAFYYVQNMNCKNATCIRELYYAGAKIDEPGKSNITPLQMAAAFGHTALIKWLLLKNTNMKKSCSYAYLLAKSQGHNEAANIIRGSMQIKSINCK
ncbi:ankyrin repeat domain-containing protein 22-like [Euwallacea fornicatus]|uniref:ankyrin repeat domain-containing protein 22-like n=1 Tax=Euwallacea fornicatus TaxID=995702 RepID=UPI00338EBB7C